MNTYREILGKKEHYNKVFQKVLQFQTLALYRLMEEKQFIECRSIKYGIDDSTISIVASK